MLRSPSFGTTQECTSDYNDVNVTGQSSAEQTENVTSLDAGSHDSTSAEMKKALDVIALNFTVQDFRKMTPASRSGWQTVRIEALAKGVDLSFVDGVVQAKQCIESGPIVKKTYPGDFQSWTLAETIEFVFAKRGSLAYAMRLWNEEMRDDSALKALYEEME